MPDGFGQLTTYVLNAVGLDYALWDATAIPVFRRDMVDDFQDKLDKGFSWDCAWLMHESCEEKYCVCECHGHGDAVGAPTVPKQPVLV